ncbi:MAG TPA: flagellar biosynthetic protein FliR [Sulfurospirillum sp. UBA11407]|nr:MAG TPA: flagellar biosynthetic protein FliR [Sulfurospirillum sp. UBA11407]
MLALVNFLQQNQVVLFLLLFARLSGLFAFFPFFSHMSIPMSIKTALVVFFTIFLFPYASAPSVTLSLDSIILAILSELLLGFIAGTMLILVFAMLQMAGMQISFVMGFTMANVMDPQTQVTTPLVSQIFTTLALVVLLAFNGHHLMILFINESLLALPLGEFYPTYNIWSYLLKATTNIFIFGFILSFPIIGMSLLADVVFGMLMKTMPQFNLLVVGFPIKIMVAFVVLITTLGAIMFVFKREFLEAIDKLSILFL